MEKSIHRKVQIVVLSQDSDNLKVLRLKTVDHKGRGSFWQNVTGTVDPGEELLDAAKRELKEETGFEYPLLDLNQSFIFIDRKNRTSIEHCFSVYLNNSPVPKLSIEHQEYEWISAHELNSRTYKYQTNLMISKKSVSELPSC